MEVQGTPKKSFCSVRSILKAKKTRCNQGGALPSLARNKGIQTNKYSQDVFW